MNDKVPHKIDLKASQAPVKDDESVVLNQRTLYNSIDSLHSPASLDFFPKAFCALNTIAIVRN